MLIIRSVKATTPLRPVVREVVPLAKLPETRATLTEFPAAGLPNLSTNDTVTALRSSPAVVLTGTLFKVSVAGDAEEIVNAVDGLLVRVPMNAVSR